MHSVKLRFFLCLQNKGILVRIENHTSAAAEATRVSITGSQIGHVGILLKDEYINGR